MTNVLNIVNAFTPLSVAMTAKRTQTNAHYALQVANCQEQDKSRKHMKANVKTEQLKKFYYSNLCIFTLFFKLK